jgi:hypothetical protein
MTGPFPDPPPFSVEESVGDGVGVGSEVEVDDAVADADETSHNSLVSSLTSPYGR